ncbi:AEC family transporter [Desulfohalovibrio reitneri]|uniref:AEC family transporter n=1 Tax=Desulfohalovibrio reitneri TaxID=1307759 RepID=UPI0004A746BA|nr:AEC family transporter [Desulfohalovibrio reitneri]
MDNILLVAVCLAAGALFRALRVLPDSAPKVLTALVLNLALPAVAVRYAHQLPLRADLLFAGLMPWLTFFLGLPLLWLGCRALNLDRTTYASLALTCAMGNTGFVGLPMIEAFYGQEWMWVGVLCDQTGTFLVLSLPGLFLATWFAGKRPSLAASLKRIATFPPFWGMLLGLATRPLAYPDWFAGLLEGLSHTLTPLAMLAVGCSLRPVFPASARRALCLGLTYKLLLAPVMMLGLYVGLLDLSGDAVRVTLFEAAMPPIVLGSVLAMEYDLEADLPPVLLGAGIPLSLATLPVWWWVLERVVP